MLRQVWRSLAMLATPPRSAGRGAGEEQQAEVAYLYFVPVGQCRGLDRLTVEVGAIEAVGVYDPELATVAVEFGVQAADGDVVEIDVAAGMAAGGGDGL